MTETSRRQQHRDDRDRVDLAEPGSRGERLRRGQGSRLLWDKLERLPLLIEPDPAAFLECELAHSVTPAGNRSITPLSMSVPAGALQRRPLPVPTRPSLIALPGAGKSFEAF